MSASNKSTKRIVFLIVLLDIMGLGLIIPAQPFLAQQFGASPALITLLGTSYSLMQLLFAPVWGSLSDRIGRRPVLLGTLAVTLLGHLTFACAGSLPLLFAARAIAGLGAANIATAQAVISDTTASDSRSSSMALVGAAFGLGFVFGPAIGGILSHWDLSAPAFFAAALSLVNIALVWRKLPETRQAHTEGRLPEDDGHGRPSLGSVLEYFNLSPNQRGLIATTFLMITAFAIMEHSIGLFIQSIWVPLGTPDRLQVSATFNTKFLVVVGISAVFVQGYLVRKLFRTLPEPLVVRCGLLVLAAALLLIPLLGATGSFALFLICAALLALGSGMFNPAMTGLVSKAASDSQQGITLALNQSGASLGRIFGPLCAGVLFERHTALPYLVGATLVLGALTVARRVLPQE